VAVQGDVTEFKPRFSRGTAGGRPVFPDQYETYNIDAGGNLVKQTLGNRVPQARAGHRDRARRRHDRARPVLAAAEPYARNRVTDQLLLLPLPAPAGGFESQWQNAGTLEGNTSRARSRRSSSSARGSPGAGRGGRPLAQPITEFNRSCFITQTDPVPLRRRDAGDDVRLPLRQGAGELPAGAPARADEFQTNDEGLLVWVGPGRTRATRAVGRHGHHRRRATAVGAPITLRDSAGNRARAHRRRQPATSARRVEQRALARLRLRAGRRAGGRAGVQPTKQRMYQYYRSADVDQAGKPQERRSRSSTTTRSTTPTTRTDWFVEDARLREAARAVGALPLGGRRSARSRALGARGAAVSLIGRNLLHLHRTTGLRPRGGDDQPPHRRLQYPRFRTVTGSVQVEF
jgi:hypothetical protein